MGDAVYSSAITASGEYIVAGNEDGLVYLFDKDSQTPVWTYNTGEDIKSVDISENGKIISVTNIDDKVYLFENNQSFSLTVNPYSPINNELLYLDDTLRWYWSSSDVSNLLFDIYLDENVNPTTKVASNLTVPYYQPQDLDVHTKYYWKVVAKDSTGTITSDVNVTL